MTGMFQLDPQLEADTHFIRDLPLCRVLLMDNALFPWLILVPRRVRLVEMSDLTEPDRALLWQEIHETAENLRRVCQAYKMNIAALGNVVRQLHVHVIARQEGDAAWPNPVWGGPQQAYAPDARYAMLYRLRHPV